MSLLTGLTSERKLGGIAVLSGFLPLSYKFKSVSATSSQIYDNYEANSISLPPLQMLNDHAKTIPIFWGHGADDPLVRAEFATRSVKFLKTQCDISETDGEALAGLKFKMYPELEHSSSPEELSDLKSWLKSVIPNSKRTRNVKSCHLSSRASPHLRHSRCHDSPATSYEHCLFGLRKIAVY